MRRSVIPFLVTLIFATGLWLAVNLAGDVQTTVRIPLTVDAPEMLAVSSPLPRQIYATVHGPAWQMVRFAFLSTPSCRVDLNDPSITAGRTIISRRVLMQSLALPSSVTLAEIDPDSISVALERRLQRTVPIVPALYVECRRGFELSSAAHVDPDSVSIAGAQSIVENLNGWSTRPASLTNVTKPIRLEIPLSDSLGDRMSISRHPVAVSVDVQETAERLFTHVPVHLLNAPSGKNIRLVPSMITVLIRGGAETLASMQSSDLRGTVDYLSSIEYHSDVLPVRITAPLHTTVIRLTPYAVTWLEHPDR